MIDIPIQKPKESDDSISVMLVDDSSVIRGALTQLLEDDPNIKIVKSVANGEMALTVLNSTTPDIIILDVEMPVMDGLTALPQILEKAPSVKVIMFSTLTDKGATTSVKALSLGAVECLVKPERGEARKGSPFQDKIIALVKNIAQSGSKTATPKTTMSQKPEASAKEIAKPLTDVSLSNVTDAYIGKPDIVAIGSSTGGPKALFSVLNKCADFDVPIVITQHMPATFTKILAQHITQQTPIECVEGEEGMVLENGRAHIAPGGKHMIFKKQGDQTIVKLDDGPPENFCKPAVDPMFRSLISIFGKKVLGVILTGMGHDGLAGSEELVKNKGRLIAQDEETSIVWGMPGAVAKAGICTAVLPIDDIGPWVRKAVLGVKG